MSVPWRAQAMTVLGTVPVFLLSAQATWMGGGSGQSPAILGIAVGAFFASAAAATIYAARVRLVGAVLFLPTAVATAVLATVRPIPLVVVAAMCLAGAGNGILQSAGNASITADGTSVRLGLGFGLKQAAIPLAALAAGWLAGSLGISLGWRSTFAGWSVLLIIFLAASRRNVAPYRPPISSRRPRRDPIHVGVLACTAAAFLGSAALTALGAFLPTWAAQVGFEPGRAAMLLAVGGAITAAARVASGLLADTLRNRASAVVGCELVIGGCGLAVLADGSRSAVLVGSAAAFALGWAWTGPALVVSHRISGGSLRSISSIQASAFGGGATGPPAFGLLQYAAGFPAAWIAASSACIIAAALMAFAYRAETE